MERRSFFRATAGLFVAGSCVSLKASRTPAAPVSVDVAQGQGVPPPTHVDLSVMLADIRRFVDDHPGAVVFPADHPQWLYLGYSAYREYRGEEQSAVFTIPISAVKGLSGPEADLLRQSAGRRALAAYLMRGT